MRILCTYRRRSDVAAVLSLLHHTDGVHVEQRVTKKEAEDGAASLTITADDGEVEVISGSHSMLVFAGRLTRVWPSDSLLCAKVDEFIEMERELLTDAAISPRRTLDWFVQLRVPRVLAKLETSLSATGWLGEFDRPTAADFCWVERLKWLLLTFDIDMAPFPALEEYMQRDLTCSSVASGGVDADADDAT